MGDYSVELLGLNFDTIFLLHPLTIYLTILLHMQAECIIKLWYPNDWSNQQRKTAVLHSSVSASIAVLFFGLDAWVNYRRAGLAWWQLGWHFPTFTRGNGSSSLIHTYVFNGLAWFSGSLIAYHVVGLVISLCTKRTTSGLGAEGAGVALETQR